MTDRLSSILHFKITKSKQDLITLKNEHGVLGCCAKPELFPVMDLIIYIGWHQHLIELGCCHDCYLIHKVYNGDVTWQHTDLDTHVACHCYTCHEINANIYYFNDLINLFAYICYKYRTFAKIKMIHTII